MNNLIVSGTKPVGMTSVVVLAAAFLSTLSLGTAASAQSTTAADDDVSGEVMVTARRKSENILKTPISISAITAEDIAAKGVTSIQDIAQTVPGLNVQNQATQGGRADRSFTAIILRGMTPTTSIAQTTSIFIDGAPVSTATALQTLTNPERVEIIKGPQSALFGRQTFAGALNVVTKTPSDHLTGSFTGMGGTRGNYDFAAEISAPIVSDVLSFRASARAQGKDGSYKNAFVPGQTLGDQSTQTGSLAIEFRPTSTLTFKAFGLMTELDDGPAATGLIASKSTPAGQNRIIGQANCNITSITGVVNPYFCGVAPGLSALAPSANTANTAVVKAYLARTSGRVLSPDAGVDGYGLVNHFYHVHFNADWEIAGTGITLSSLTAFNSERKSELADLDNYYSVGIGTGPEGYYNYAYMIEGRARDFSQEVRASFENGGPLHASVGGSYLNARAQQGAGGPSFGPPTASGATQNRTFGAFGSIGYDFSPNVTISADARYQIDKVYAFAGANGVTATNSAFVPAGFYPENSQIATQTYRNFLPRVIGQYNYGKAAMIYASYSTGVNPAVFNTTFASSPQPEVVQEATRLGYKVAVEPEKITNYEIGSKGRLFGVLRHDAAAFIAVWTNQIQSQSTIIASRGLGPAVVGIPLQAVASVNSGAVRISGLEANLGIDVARGLTVDIAGAYIDSYILRASNAPVTNFYNIRNFRGKENPYTSRWSATASAAYTRAVSDDVDGYGRIDFSYKSGSYADVANIVRSPDLSQVNVRLGIRNKSFSFEGYVTNLFNDRAYYNVVSGSLLATGVTTGTYGALLAQLRELRTVGIRGTFNF